VYTILWEFLVAPAKRAEFERAYAADGPWAALFGRAAGFVDSRLLRCTEQDGRYLTVDRWRSHGDHVTFQRDFGTEYTALDARLEGLADVENRIGAFEDSAAS
jgi:heme-degrading monooxygenase HmoA